MWAFTLILHLKKLKEAWANDEFSKICNEIKKHEKKLWLFGLIFYFIILIYWISLFIIELTSNWVNELDENGEIPDLKKTIWYITYTMQNWFSYLRIGLFAIMWAAEIILFLKLTAYLESQLNYYYIKVKTNRKITMVWNIMFLSFVVILDTIKHIAGFTFESLWNTETYKNDSYFVRYLYLISIIVIFVMFFVYFFWNIRNIKFKIYMYNILYGYRVSSKFENISMFILNSPWYKQEKVSFVSNESLNDKSSIIESVRLIFEHTNINFS